MNRYMTRVFGMVAVALALAARAGAGEARANKTVTLARHETVAEFVGTNYHRCLGRTSLCPDKCGSSGTLASFKIVEYVKYEKLGEYGDPKCERYDFLVEDNMKNAKVPAEIRNTVNSLNKGDRVRLSWKHDYVTKDGCSQPERPITKLERMAD